MADVDLWLLVTWLGFLLLPHGPARTILGGLAVLFAVIKVWTMWRPRPAETIDWLDVTPDRPRARHPRTGGKHA